MCRALGERLKVDCVNEAASDLGEAGLDISPDSTWEALSTIVTLQMARERRARGSFVADRGAIDAIAYTEVRQAGHPEGLGALVGPALVEIATDWYWQSRYDLVMYHRTPCGDRGAELHRKHSAFFSRLSAAFEQAFSLLGTSPVVIPPDTDLLDRVELAIASLRQNGGQR